MQVQLLSIVRVVTTATQYNTRSVIYWRFEQSVINWRCVQPFTAWWAQIQLCETRRGLNWKLWEYYNGDESPIRYVWCPFISIRSSINHLSTIRESRLPFGTHSRIARLSSTITTVTYNGSITTSQQATIYITTIGKLQLKLVHDRTCYRQIIYDGNYICKFNYWALFASLQRQRNTIHGQ